MRTSHINDLQKLPLTHYDGVKVASHEHGGVLGSEVKVTGREEGRQLSHCFLRLLHAEAIRVFVLSGGRVLLVSDGGG